MENMGTFPITPCPQGLNTQSPFRSSDCFGSYSVTEKGLLPIVNQTFSSCPAQRRKWEKITFDSQIGGYGIFDF